MMMMTIIVMMMIIVRPSKPTQPPLVMEQGIVLLL